MLISIAIISLLFSAFFSGAEIAFISANKLQLELDKDKGRFYSRIIAFFSKNESDFITTMLVGNNFCLVIYGIFMGEKIVEILFSNLKTEPLPLNILFIQTLISTFIILID